MLNKRLFPLFCALLALLSFPVSAEVTAPADRALLNALLQGGHVIFFRHGITDKKGKSRVEVSQLGDCSLQRNLSAQGIAQTREMGRVIAQLKIPVDKVLTSAYCRCKDTAMNLFGRAEVTDFLHFALHLKKEDRASQSKQFREFLSSSPAAGKNNILVSHTANLKEATGIWPKQEGVAYVFKPTGEGGYTLVGRILPEEWHALAN